MRNFEGFVQHALLVFLFFLPLFFPPIFADLFDLPKVLFFFTGIIFLALLTALNVFRKKKILLPPQSFRRLLIIFFLIYSLSTFFSIQPLTSLLGVWHYQYSTYTGGLIHLLALYLLFLTVYQLKKTEAWQGDILLYLVASGVLAAIFGFYQYFTHFELGEWNFRIRSTIGEPNRLGLFLVTILPLAFTLFVEQKKPFHKITAFLVLNLIFLAILLTFSRTSWLVVFSLIVIGLVDKRKKLNQFLAKNIIYLLASGLIFFIATATNPTIQRFLKEIFLTRITHTKIAFDQKRGSVYLRLLEWESGRKMFLDQSFFRQLIGNGPETIKFLYPEYRSPKIDQFTPEKYWQTLAIRQQYLHYLNTIGLLGLIAFLSLIIWTIKNFLSIKRKTFFHQGIFYSFLTIVISNFFYYQTITTHTLFWFFLGLLIPKENFDLTKKIK